MTSKVMVLLRIAVVAVSGLVLGCAQTSLLDTQENAPIESPTMRQQAAKASQPKAVVLAPKTQNIDPVVNISPLEDDGVGALVPIVEPARSMSTTEKASVPSQANAATQQLLNDAQAAFVQGDLVAAESVTNRGLRIAPKDPALWLQLAKIRLGQGKFLEAISLSERAQVLAANNPAVKIDALQIIATAYESRGDEDRAAEAREKARELSGALGTH